MYDAAFTLQLAYYNTGGSSQDRSGIEPELT